MSVPSTTDLRIAIVEDQPLFRSMLEHTLSGTPGLRVVASVGTTTEASRVLRPGMVDCAILDIDLPDGNGISLGVTLRRRMPTLGILLLSAHDAMDLLLDLPADVAAGWGYLSKTSSTSEEVLVNAVRAAAIGETEKSVQNHVNGMYATLGIDSDPQRNPRVSAALRLLEETGPAV